MICTNCQRQLDTDARFCPKCGGRVGEEEPLEIILDDSEDTSRMQDAPPRQQTADPSAPLFTLQPTFIWSLAFLYAIIPAIILAVIIAVVIPCIGWLLAIPVCVAAVPIIMILHRNTYQKTVYTFYPDQVEYAEGFLARNFNTVRYQNVVEVTLTQGFIERSYGLGTIVLATSGGMVRIASIEHPDRTYQMVRELIDGAQAR